MRLLEFFEKEIRTEQTKPVDHPQYHNMEWVLSRTCSTLFGILTLEKSSKEFFHFICVFCSRVRHFTMTSQPQLPLSMRHDVDFSNITNAGDSIPSPPPPPPSNPEYDTNRVFWSVNAFILFLIFITGIWCCFVQKHVFSGTDRRIASDQFYRERRRRRQEAEKTESPEKRRQKLLASFSRHAVQMVSSYPFDIDVYRGLLIIWCSSIVE